MGRSQPRDDIRKKHLEEGTERPFSRNEEHSKCRRREHGEMKPGGRCLLKAEKRHLGFILKVSQESSGDVKHGSDQIC